MTSDSDEKLLSYFPRKRRSKLESDDILGIDDESLVNPGKASTNMSLKKIIPKSLSHGKARRILNLKTNYQVRKRRRIIPCRVLN